MILAFQREMFGGSCNWVETAHHETSEPVCGYFGKGISNMVFSLSSSIMLMKLVAYIGLVTDTLACIWEGGFPRIKYIKRYWIILYIRISTVPIKGKNFWWMKNIIIEEHPLVLETLLNVFAVWKIDLQGLWMNGCRFLPVVYGAVGFHTLSDCQWKIILKDYLLIST